MQIGRERKDPQERTFLIVMEAGTQAGQSKLIAAAFSVVYVCVRNFFVSGVREGVSEERT